MQPQIHIIAGPTASGKSAHALELAENIDGVIINADSQQVYREFRTLTARPSEQDEARVPHRLYGFLSVSTPCSAGIWLKYAKMEIDWALEHGKPAILVGGTGLYIKALLEGIAHIPEVGETERNQAQNDYIAMGELDFRSRLQAVDPEAEAKISPNDRQRLTRAWEVFLSSGKPLTYWQNQKQKPCYPREQFTITKIIPSREELYARCDTRVLTMIEEGAVEEVKDHLPLINHHSPLPAIIGVPELSTYLAGTITLDEAIASIQQSTRNYAKRQLTWFRHQLDS